MHFSPRNVGIAAAVVTVAIWTSFIVVARYMALKTLTPWDIVACRIVGAALVLLPWGLWLVRRQRAVHPAGAAQHTWLGLSPLSRRLTVLVGAFGGVAYAVLAYNAFVFAPAAHGSVLLPGMLPLSTALFSVWLLGERLSPARLGALALILCGALLVGGASLLKAFDGGEVWKGDVLFVCASTCWAVYTVLCRRHQLAAVPATIAVVVFCVLAYLPFYALGAASGLLPSRLAAAPWGEIAFQTVWQGMGSVVISGIAFTKMVQHFGPIRSTMMTAVVPGLSALSAVLFLGEPLYWNLLAGLTLVTLGIVLGVRAASPVAIHKIASSAVKLPAKG
jgi:drug/metabolite transporter (DMT)-like permease